MPTMKTVDRSDRKFCLRGAILRAGVFSKSNKSSGSPATACHPGAQGPSMANALSRGHSPENHPDSPPNNITYGGEAREDSLAVKPSSQADRSGRSPREPKLNPRPR